MPPVVQTSRCVQGAGCWQRQGGTGREEGSFFLFQYIFMNKASARVHIRAPLRRGAGAAPRWVVVLTPVARHGRPDLMWSEVIPHNYYEQVLFSLEIKSLLSKYPIFMKYCFSAAKFDWDFFQKLPGFDFFFPYLKRSQKNSIRESGKSVGRMCFLLAQPCTQPRREDDLGL